MRVVEKGGDFGGTWYWNRYPGIRCDNESYIYMPLLEEMGYIPTERYAHGSEILRHLQAIAARLDLYSSALLQTVVSDLRWDQASATWRLETDRGDRLTARYVINSNGPLSLPKLPRLPGITEFQGTMFHTSRWDYGFTGGDAPGGLDRLAGKTVGIIGTGATAIQCIPYLAETAEHLYVFQRTPNAVDVRGNRPTDPEWARSLRPGWQRERMLNYTAVVSGEDVERDLVDDGWTEMYQRATNVAAQRKARELGRSLTPAERGQLIELADLQIMERIRSRVQDVVRDEATAEKLKPWYGRWCKRPAFHDEFLQAFNEPNVTLVDTDGRGIDRVIEHGVVVDGQEYEIDCLIFGTGFDVGGDVTDLNGFDMVGRGGVRQSEHWKDGPRTFLGVMIHHFPNLFMTGQQQTGFTPNYQQMLDEQTRHIAYVIGCAEASGAAAVEASGAAEERWVSDIRAHSRSGRRYFEDCTPGYLTREGNLDDPNTVLSSGYWEGPVKFFQLLADWRSAGDLQGVELTGADGSPLVPVATAVQTVG